MNTHRRNAPSFRRRLSSVALAAVGGLAVLAGCNQGTTSDRAPGRNPAGDVIEIPSGNFASVWRAELPLREDEKVASVWLNDDSVFVYTSDRRALWFDRGSGRIKAVPQVAPETDTLYPPVTLSDRVVFISTGEIQVFSRFNNRLMHSAPLRFSASSGAAGEGTVVFLGQDHPQGGRLVAIDTQPKNQLRQDKQVPYDVSPKWELMPRGAVSAAPAVYQGMVFAGSRDGGVYAVRADTRANLWPGLEPGHFKTDGAILADVAADKDGVYVASQDSKLYRLDLNTGRVRWRYYSETPLREDSDPVPTNTHVFLYVRDKGLVAIDKSGVNEIRDAKWILPEGRQFLASDDKYVYVRTNRNAVVAVDKATGKVAFSSRRQDFTHFATNTSDKDNNIYATTESGLLYRIRPVLKPGTIGEWVMEFEGEAAGPLAMGDGRSGDMR